MRKVMMQSFTDKQMIAFQTAKILAWNRVIGELKAEILDLQSPVLQARITNQRQQLKHLEDKIARMAGQKSAYVAGLRAEIMELKSDLVVAKGDVENVSRSNEGLSKEAKQLKGEFRDIGNMASICAVELGYAKSQIRKLEGELKSVRGEGD